MEVKEFLSRYHNLQIKIRKKKDYINFCEERSRLIPGPSYGDKEGTNPTRELKAPFERWIIRKIDAERELAKFEKELIKAKAEIEDAIGKINDDELEQIIIYRYIDRLTWPEICKMMSYSKTSIKRKHKSAIEILTKILTL